MRLTAQLIQVQDQTHLWSQDYDYPVNDFLTVEDDVAKARNQSDEAFEWLDRAYAQRDDGLIATKVDPLLKSLHSNPRFAAL
jgi:hypothetical protein